MQKKYIVRLTQEERDQLQETIKKLSGRSQKVRRAHILLKARARTLVRRIEFCYTPKHGRWLNIAENELSSMTRQCLSGRRIGDIETLKQEIGAWSTDVNNSQRGADWQMKIADVRCKLKSVYPKIQF